MIRLILFLFQELPEQWQATKKLALTVKQQVAPLQAAEVACIRKKITMFDTHITYYREVFKRYDVNILLLPICDYYYTCCFYFY